MPYGHGTIDASLASAASLSTVVKILGFSGIAIEMPAFGTLLGSNAASVRVQVANTSTTTSFKRLVAQGVYSASSGVDEWETLQSSGNFMVVCDPAVGFAYMRLHLSTAATDAISATIHLYQK